jgi:hypothetical protein
MEGQTWSRIMRTLLLSQITLTLYRKLPNSIRSNFAAKKLKELILNKNRSAVSDRFETLSPSSKFNSNSAYVGVHLQGGLGNQLFQLAAGIEVAILYKKQLVLDDSALKLDYKRNFALSFLGINPDTPYEISIIGNKLQVTAQTKTEDITWHELRENTFHYRTLDSLSITSHNCLLIGYWQSDKYFSNVEMYLINYINSYLSKVDSADLVLHFRRGDFEDPETRAYHGILTDAYYVSALKLMPQVSKVYLVSEDLNLRKTLDYLSSEFPKVDFITYSKSSSVLDSISLMAGSKNLVTANSSFSWWAGKLSRSVEGKIIAPRNYFSDDTLRVNNICDLYPENWILI